ncbi:XRE family transcriptional regulator [Lactococcus carnosus]|uniref:XRE family transcriptional regulator n=1 Tax=Pseudolactococcus carnosus TaxID=2749961 RepID=UPI001FB99C6D|nr:S24 family peptidase [Lactococcus carnosus]MCJ2003202.1 helix-turn-helix transcriptional regulator [Lactococcus carnosus]
MLNTKRLKSLRKKLEYTQKDVALKLKVTQQNYQKWESGFTKSPTTETIIELANIFNTSVEYLTNTEILPIYQALSETRQNELVSIAEKKLKDQLNENKVIPFIDNLIPYQVISEQSLSAGYGNGYTDEQETYTVYWDKDVRYDYAAEVEGNSMEPKYHNGDIALIRKTHVNDYDGCVCVIDDVANQRVYIKRIHIEDTHVRLESLNKDTYDNGELIYPDILLENTENLRLIGKVVDSFKPIEIK